MKDNLKNKEKLSAEENFDEVEDLDNSEDLDDSENESEDESENYPEDYGDLTVGIKSPLKAIRAQCLDCCCGSHSEVKFCTVVTCKLYPFRFGKNPYRKARILSEEQKAEMRDRMLNARLSKGSAE